MHIKANDTVFDASQFPVFLAEDHGLSFLAMNEVTLHIRFGSGCIAKMALDRVTRAFANGNRQLLDLDRDFDVIDLFMGKSGSCVTSKAA